MGTTPIHKLLFTMSVPAIISMFVQACYNIVDSIFVARVSEKALEAVTLAFPLQMLIIAFATGLGVGTNALISRKLGEKKTKESVLAAQTGLFLTLISAFVFIFIGFFASGPFIRAFSSDAETISMGVSYVSIVLIFSPGAFVDIFNGKVFQATGNMKIPMITQLAGAVVNIILDPLLIFGIGFPKMGVTGAAVATVSGQIFAMILGIIIMAKTKQDVKPFFNRSFRLKKYMVADIMRISLPVIIMKSINSITVTILNAIIKSYEYAITILGIFFKLQSFVIMPVFGLTQGALPIMSYNYGANEKKRFLSAFKLTVLTALCIMVVGLLLFEVIPGPLMSMFGASGQLMTSGIKALRILGISFVFAAVGITVTTTFQSINGGLPSLLMSLLRQIVLLIPIAAVMTHLIGIDGTWWAYPVSEIIVAAIFLPLVVKSIHKKFDKLDSVRNQKAPVIIDA